MRVWFFSTRALYTLSADNLGNLSWSLQNRPNCRLKKCAEHSLLTRLPLPPVTGPSVSDLAGGNSDHGPRKTRIKTQTNPDSVFSRDKRNSDHGPRFWGGKTQTMVWVWGVFGVGVGEGALKHAREKIRVTLKCNRTWLSLDSENPRAHKNKIGTSPPKPQIPPPPS